MTTSWVHWVGGQGGEFESENENWEAIENGGIKKKERTRRNEGEVEFWWVLDQDFEALLCYERGGIKHGVQFIYFAI